MARDILNPYETPQGSDTFSTQSPIALQESLSKHVLRIRDLISSYDPNRIIYPRGIVSSIRESKEDSPPVKRIELFARDDKDTFGVLRTLFIAYSNERKLLDMADASNGVIQVRSLRPIRAGSSNDRAAREIVEDRLLLKRSEELPPLQNSKAEVHGIFTRFKEPHLVVSARWRERMNLETGDRLIVSNPLESYEVPPPNI